MTTIEVASTIETVPIEKETTDLGTEGTEESEEEEAMTGEEEMTREITGIDGATPEIDATETCREADIAAMTAASPRTAEA